jgi:hypothetical protein
MATPKSKEPRRFAPLKEGADKTLEGVPKLKGVVFDVDGTLWLVWRFPTVCVFVDWSVFTVKWGWRGCDDNDNSVALLCLFGSLRSLSWTRCNADERETFSS